MIYIVIMAHLSTNQHLYSAMFSKMQNIRYVVMPVDGPNIKDHIPTINAALQEFNINDNELDFVLLSSNYGMVGSDEFNKPAFEYFCERFKNVQLIAVGFTPASIIKAVNYDNIYAIGTCFDTEAKRSMSPSLLERIISNQHLREMIEQAELKKQMQIDKPETKASIKP